MRDLVRAPEETRHRSLRLYKRLNPHDFVLPAGSLEEWPLTSSYP